MQSSKWEQPLRFLVIGIIFLVIIWLITTLQPLISSFVVAALLAYVLHPLVNIIIARTRFSHSAAVNIVYILFLLVLGAIPAMLVPVILEQTKGLSPDFEFMASQLQAFTEKPLAVGPLSLSLETLVSDLTSSIAQTFGDLATNFAYVLAGISTNFLWILVIMVLVYYLLKDSHRLIDWLLGFFSDHYRHHAQNLLAEIDSIWGSFLRGQLLLMLFVGALSWLGASIVGMPGAFVIGLIAGILDIIPSLGPMLAAIVAALVALFEGSSYLPVSNIFFAVIVLGVFLLIQQIENIWVRPAVMGRRLRLHPAIVLVGVFTSLALFGILVTLIIIPLMATLSVLFRYFRLRTQDIDPYPHPADAPSHPPAEDAAS